VAAISIKSQERLAAVLEAFSALDDVRWRTAANYNLINYCATDLTADEKLLSHWLCYVADRRD
jgi:hypothetical protein